MRHNYHLLGALLLGVVLGGAAATLYEQRAFKKHYNRLCLTFEAKTDRWVLLDFTSSVREDVNTLTALRRGKIDYVLDLKEYDLSATIHNLALTFPEDVLSMSNTVSLLKVVASYRAEHPFESGEEEMDRDVENLLALATGRNVAPSRP